ncbi:PilW family protein [Dyella sedimenti]|uniref:PilW family protein n=1 Tax=Dyella sedimenti TaxID=2919947 RepID=UPI001FA96929|nr:PilW family protein [Dyella sedimenti]
MRPLVGHGQRGLTLIELMVAMLLGLLVAAGIITVFLSTSNSNRVQNQLAMLQEEGRYAIARLTRDLRQANGHYCSNSGGLASQTSTGLLLDGLRAPTVYANDLMSALSDVSTPWGTNPYPAKPNSPYYLPSFLSMRGYDCDATTCRPALPAGIPAAGVAIGQRVAGSSVLTVRYLDTSRGWALGGTSTVTTAADGSVSSINLVPKPNVEPPLGDFKAGHLALLANCSSAAIFAVDGPNAAGQLSPAAVGTDPGTNTGKPVAQEPQSAPRLFDFNTDYQTVTYFLQVVDAGNGQTTGALVRRANGTSQEIARGVERLDFLYGVENGDGNTSMLTATQIDSGTYCPPSVPVKLGTDPGCLWRAVKSIEVRLLMSGQQRLPTLTANETVYSYAADGDGGLAAPQAHAITPSQQGFADQMLRREFSALVSLRNYNP